MRAILACCISASFILLAASAADRPADSKSGGPQYILGANDQINVEVVELPEFSGRTYRIDADGSVSLPLVGRVRAAGLTLAQFQDAVEKQLHSQVKNPHVVTGLVEVRSQPVSVMGQVNTPGTEMLQGNKTLFDVLAMAGGLKPDAGDVIKITRQKEEGPLNLKNAAADETTGSVTASVSVRDVVDLRDPSANILMRPHDSISVPRAQVVYVIGNVKKAGGFALSQNKQISALEALSLAEGMAPNAAPKSARISRLVPGDSINREQIKVDLKAILAGKQKDIPMQPDDILYVPDNSARRTTGKILETGLATVSGLVIWRGF
ncbi:MAG TPA: polysaccharide biosynthesis/export family protein [Bryobacteraceae bacterium]|nr:polysaccharide biosynthesis/export family protein [Bryobacteraceae bacterium]